MTQDFATYMAAKGMVLDIAIHAPDPGDDPRNYHVHVLATMRSIHSVGFGNKVRDWNKDTELEAWKEHWSNLGAQHLERAGFGLEADRFRVGHLTLEKQREHAILRGDHDWADSLDRTPGKHMGPQASAMEKQGKETRKGEQNREIETRNKRRAENRDLSRTAGEIRLAYQLTRRAQAFADALEDRGLILARVSHDDFEKLGELEKRIFEEKKNEHERKLRYLGKRIEEEKLAGNTDKVKYFTQDREHLEEAYQASLPWFMRTGGVPPLTTRQREMASNRYEKWLHKGRFSFEDYVSYVQGEWQHDPTHISRHNLKDLVVVDATGDVYGLNFRTTGEHPKQLRKYLNDVATSPLLSVTGAWEVFAAVHEHRREEAQWPERERVWPTLPKELPGLRPSPPGLIAPHGRWRIADVYVTEDRRRLDAPEQTNKPHSSRFPEQPVPGQIWEAFQRNRHDPNAFAAALADAGILLCVASKTEADQSHRQATFAREIGRYSPRYDEDEILAVGPDARVYKLNKKTTGAEPNDVERSLRRLDRTQLPTITEATETMHERAEARDATALLMSRLFPVKRQEFEPGLGDQLKSFGRGVSRGLGYGFDRTGRTGYGALLLMGLATSAFVSLVAPTITPEERKEAEILEFERRKRAEQRTNRDRQSTERDR